MYSAVDTMCIQGTLQDSSESYFVVRTKKNLQHKCTKWKRRLPKNVLTDSVIELTDVNTQKKYPERLRLVRFHDDEQDRDFAFLTNAFQLTSLELPISTRIAGK